MPVLSWVPKAGGAPGVMAATLELSAVKLKTSRGTMRTFAWNGMIPGPLIRMKPCGVYHLTIKNGLEDWAVSDQNSAAGAPLNTLHDPSTTNVHLHGLHISGEAPGDDTFTVVEAGGENEFIYTIPCDHSGGTNCSALQTNGGAAGMLVIEPGEREIADMPVAYRSLPEQYLVIQDFSVKDLTTYSLVSGDAVFDTDIPDTFAAANGCAQRSGGAQITVAAGQWTRLRMLHAGSAQNAVITIEPAAAAATAAGAAGAAAAAVPRCDMVLLQKDGAWLGSVPRTVRGAAPGGAPALFFTPSSRNDVAIRCADAGVEHEIRYTQVNNSLRPDAEVIGTVTVTPDARPPAPDLPEWGPCRPAYLKDLTVLTPEQLGAAYPLELRQTINGAQFEGPDVIMHELTLGVPEQWLVTGTDQHPLHVHIGGVSAENQWDDAPDWLVVGDWMDSLSARGRVPILVHPERFSGPMVIHCHITSHADQGMMAVFTIKGRGADALTPPQLAMSAPAHSCMPVAIDVDLTGARKLLSAKRSQSL
ncbi:hypothetical protein JKP88DRAFT_304920 [Tribonema minus]|uniref:Plastocyanin-like domain-containing protein n=1 Tax=Tribonema minus TaxID=303371 RepID=A0A835Z8B6_9STRA|nr:hypothetical protein JKP88DRAFT_304920 [Tribonema minus]